LSANEAARITGAPFKQAHRIIHAGRPSRVSAQHRSMAVSDLPVLDAP